MRGARAGELRYRRGVLARLAPLVVVVLVGCATFEPAGPPLPSPLLLAATDEPTLYLRPDADAARIGYVSADALLELAGSEEHGRVPVRIEGALRARGYVARDRLMLRVQRRGRVRGTPVYLGPGDRVSVLGLEPGAQRLLVRATARLGERALGTYEGSYPAEGLAAGLPPSDAQGPDPGRPYTVPADVSLALSELPGEPARTSVAAQGVAYEARVLNESEGWLALRVGSGPYLVGWTRDVAAIATSPRASQGLSSEASATASASSSQALSTVAASPTAPAPAAHDTAQTAVPRRLAGEPGALKRVRAGTQVMFGEQVIGVFTTDGWARVIKSSADGYSDVFAAADDQLAIRGLIRTVELLEVSETSTPEAAR